jgi:hypothetical protein
MLRALGSCKRECAKPVLAEWIAVADDAGLLRKAAFIRKLRSCARECRAP